MASEIDVLIRAHHVRQLPVLKRAIRSVAEQSFDRPIRILLETSNLAKQIELSELLDPKDTPMTLSFQHSDITHNFDSRFVLLRNGIERASAPWLYFLDCDDVLLPDGLATLYSNACNAKTHLVIANVALVTETPTGTTRAPYRQNPVTTASLVRHNEVPFNAVLVARDAALKAIKTSPALSLYEDYGFLLTLIAQAPPVVLPIDVIVADYNTGDGQARKYADRKAFSLDVIQRLRERLFFPVSGVELIAGHSSPVREHADGALLATLPEVPLETLSLRGYADSTQLHDGLVRIDGWCMDPTQPTKPIWGVYAILAEGCAALLDERTTRADVNASLQVEGQMQGFAGVITAPEGIISVWVVRNGCKARLPNAY